jgi:hypothetical protein
MGNLYENSVGLVEFSSPESMLSPPLVFFWTRIGKEIKHESLKYQINHKNKQQRIANLAFERKSGICTETHFSLKNMI